MKVKHCNFLSAKRGFQDNEVFCKPDMTSSWFGRKGALRAILHDAFWKSDHDFLIVIDSNFVSGLHGFWDNKVFCKPDMTSSLFLRQGALSANFHDGFWKSDNNFLIVLHSKFLFEMRGLRDNEVLLQARYDVIVISPLGGTSGELSWRILKVRPRLPHSVP